MSDVRSMLIDTATKIMKNKCSKELITLAEKGEWPTEMWNKLEETGMPLVYAPEEAGGVGGDLGDTMGLIKVAGQFAAPIPLAETILSNWLLGSVGLPVLEGPLTLAPILKEDSFEFSETNENFISVSGTARAVPWARDAHYIILTGTTDQNNRVVTFVDGKQVQITTGVSLSGEPRDEVMLNNILIEKSNCAMNPRVTDDELQNVYTLMRVFSMSGALEKVLDLSLQYSKERTQFGRPIGKFQAVKQQLAVLAGEVVASRIAAESALHVYDQYKSTDEIAMAKIQVGEATDTVTKIAHQVHAAMGFTDEHPLQQYTRRLWTWRDECGSESEWAHVLGEKIVSMDSDQLWSTFTLPNHMVKN